MTNVWCVRPEFGTYTKQFAEGGYVAIGCVSSAGLSTIHSRDALYPLYKQAYLKETSNIVSCKQVGQIAHFMLETQASDYAITPAADTQWLHYGQIAPKPGLVRT